MTPLKVGGFGISQVILARSREQVLSPQTVINYFSLSENLRFLKENVWARSRSIVKLQFPHIFKAVTVIESRLQTLWCGWIVDSLSFSYL